MGLLYKYTNAEVGIQHWLREREMSFTSVKALNDPFEAGARLEGHEFEEAVHSRRLAARILRKQLSRDPTAAELEAFMTTEMAIETWDALGSVIAWRVMQHNFRTVGVLSLSHEFDSILMWSHYSKMSGLVLGFDDSCKEIRKSQYATLTGANPVRYEEKRANIRGDNVVEKLRAMCLVKSPWWKYENEMRCFRKVKHNKTREVILFRPESLKRIIVGVGMSTSEATEVWEIKHHSFPDARLELATPNSIEFKIDIFPAPWVLKRYLEFFNDKYVQDTALYYALNTLV